jgi:hypothetical protein
VNVVGLRARVESAGKVMVPELVTVIVAVFEKIVSLDEKFMVPEFVKCLFATDVEMVIGEADEKLIVLSALLAKPVFVIAVRLGKLSVSWLFVNIVTPDIVSRFEAVRIPEFVIVPMFEMVVPV